MRMRALTEKYERLLALLRESGGAAVAFSGGVDSTLLLAAAKEALGERCLAVTVRSPFLPESEAREAEALCARLGVQLVRLEMDTLSLPGVAENPPERCYLCKRAILGAIRDAAGRRGVSCVLEGSNADDARDYRPGAKAVKELGVRSPLLEVGLTKAEIRRLSKKLGLPTAAKPAMACLASRFPHNQALTAEDLGRVEAAEEYLGTLGLTQKRVRVHPGGVARIEVLPREARRVRRHAAQIDARLKELGFRYVALDLGGYQTGNMNPER